MENLTWNEIRNTDKIRAYQLADEPEVIYVIRVRKNEYMVLHEDGYDYSTGKVDFLDENRLMKMYGINGH